MARGTQPKWIVLRSFAGWEWRNLPGDLGAGLTLAAIAVPEQMATARLGGFAPEIGFYVFIAGTLAFALFGANRYLSSGADSTITPIFAGALGLLAVQGSPAYGALAAALALGVGAILIASGLARLGWIASFLSAPVTTGFLAGIGVHIVISQLPALLDLAPPGGDLLARSVWIATHAGQTNPLRAVPRRQSCSRFRLPANNGIGACRARSSGSRWRCCLSASSETKACRSSAQPRWCGRILPCRN